MSALLFVMRLWNLFERFFIFEIYLKLNYLKIHLKLGFEIFTVGQVDLQLTSVKVSTVSGHSEPRKLTFNLGTTGDSLQTMSGTLTR